MHGDGIGSEQAQRAPHHRSVGHGVAWRWNGASSVYLGNGGEEAQRIPWRPRRRAVSTRRGYGTGVAARLAGAAGQQWRREVVGARGGMGTADAREAVATTDVRRGGGGVLDVAGRVAWAQGERNRRRTQGRRW